MIHPLKRRRWINYESVRNFFKKENADLKDRIEWEMVNLNTDAILHIISTFVKETVLHYLKTAVQLFDFLEIIIVLD